MNYVHIVAMLAVLQFIGFSFMVGRAREKYGVKAPAISGHEEFDKEFRVQMNTLEQLVCFLPALFVASLYWSPLFVAAVGVVYLVGRMLYRRAYISNPSTRAVGFLLTIVPTAVLVLAALAGALFKSGG